MPHTHSAVFVFAGPTLFGTPFHTDLGRRGEDVIWQEPARRGDIERLMTEYTPGVIALADGTFHAYPSVGHSELREAVTAGWTVYGLCSMGAIRACELKHLGMRPWGRVAAMFCENPDMPDDEVALVHGADHPYFPISEPLVHIREFLHQMRTKELLTGEHFETVLVSLRERWYGERTLANLRGVLSSVVAAPVLAALDLEMADFDRFRLKQKDLVAFMHAKPWVQAATSRLAA